MPRPLKTNTRSSFFMIFVLRVLFSQISGHALYKFINFVLSSFVDVFLITMSAVPLRLLATVPIFWSSWEWSWEEAWFALPWDSTCSRASCPGGCHDLRGSAVAGCYTWESASLEHLMETLFSLTLTCHPTLSNEIFHIGMKSAIITNKCAIRLQLLAFGGYIIKLARGQNYILNE